MKAMACACRERARILLQHTLIHITIKVNYHQVVRRHTDVVSHTRCTRWLVLPLEDRVLARVHTSSAFLAAALAVHDPVQREVCQFVRLVELDPLVHLSHDNRPNLSKYSESAITPPPWSNSSNDTPHGDHTNRTSVRASLHPRYNAGPGFSPRPASHQQE